LDLLPAGSFTQVLLELLSERPWLSYMERRLQQQSLIINSSPLKIVPDKSIGLTLFGKKLLNGFVETLKGR
jgi:hypothetical protein